MDIRIQILMNITDVSYGGTHQFLRGLKKYLIAHNYYQEDIRRADIVLFDGPHDLSTVARMKRRYPEKPFIHRIDGPMRLYNHINDRRDPFTYIANAMLADATIFQSQWSSQANYSLGLTKTCFETVIMNAPNSTIFHHTGKIPFSTDRKIRLIATSWSPHWNKGFATYQWLDEHLNFEKYQMMFIGRSPIQFKHIHHIPPLPAQEIAQYLRNSDIYISASRFEACSNAVLEALHCGLPVIAPNTSSQPEIVGQGGSLFHQEDEIPALLEQIIEHYSQYQANIQLPSLEKVGKMYYDFMRSIWEAVQQRTYTPKTISMLEYARIVGTIQLDRWLRRFKSLTSRLRATGKSYAALL